jgi:hypothetical protein
MTLSLPNIIFALILALLYGALYHVLRGGNGLRLLYDFGLSILGFTLGHFFGVWRGWDFFMMGALNLGVGSIGSVVFLILGEWLARVDVNKKSSV